MERPNQAEWVGRFALCVCATNGPLQRSGKLRAHPTQRGDLAGKRGQLDWGAVGSSQHDG